MIWPIEELASLTTEPRRPTAVVIDLSDVVDAERRLLDSGLAVRLAQAGVEIFALVGADSERIHDALDWKVEDASLWHVLTTWHNSDIEDAAVTVAALARTNDFAQVAAVLDDASASGAELVDTVRKALGPRAVME